MGHVLLMGCSYSAHAIPHQDFLLLLKHATAVIRLTSCRLSGPLIKEGHPVYGLALSLGVSSQQPCIILTLGVP